MARGVHSRLGAVRHLALVCSLLGCVDGDDTRFQVVDVTPADGETVSADAEVSVTFSEPHDVARCGVDGDLGTTADLYAHLTPAIARRAADRMDAILTG